MPTLSLPPETRPKELRVVRMPPGFDALSLRLKGQWCAGLSLAVPVGCPKKRRHYAFPSSLTVCGAIMYYPCVRFPFRPHSTTCGDSGWDFTRSSWSNENGAVGLNALRF